MHPSNNAIIDLMKRNNLSKLESLIDDGYLNVNDKLVDYSILYRDSEEPNETWYGEYSLLEWAYRLDNIELMKMLINKGADVNQVNRYGTVLHMVCFNEEDVKHNVEMVKLLLESGANPNDQSYIDEVPMCVFSPTLTLEVAKLLIEYGTDIKKISRSSLLYDLCWTQPEKADLITYLLEQGVEPNPPAFKDAYKNGLTDVMMLMLKKKPDLNICLPLIDACRVDGKDDIFQLLLEHADPNCICKEKDHHNGYSINDRKGLMDHSPLYIAHKYNNSKKVNQLIAKGAKLTNDELLEWKANNQQLVDQIYTNQQILNQINIEESK
jgi:ankyrin repeat protein